MERPKDQDGIDALQERLYQRGSTSEPIERTKLTDDEQPVRRDWDVDQGEPGVEAKPTPEPVMPKASKTRKKIRTWLIVFALLFFVGAVMASIFYMFVGQNTISGDNITIEVNGPFSVGGGETVDLQVAISNFNTIPIESAQLIVEYPAGSQSAFEEGKEIYRENIPLDQIGSGELIKAPVSFVTFGEENEEKIVNIEVEYRVRGSNATFSKGAEPLRYKISSSPVVLLVDSISQISSGQEVDVTLTIASNSGTALDNVLIRAEYPFGFDFVRSVPDTISGQDTWKIDRLEPEEQYEITITGIVVGKQNEDRYFDFEVGVPNERDQFSLASVYTTGSTEMTIEQPFLDVGVSVNSDESETVVVNTTQTVNVKVDVINSLDDVLYDGVVEINVLGNAVDTFNITATNGFFDSTKNIIRYDAVDVETLNEILPGRTGSVVFTMSPKQDVDRTPEINLEVTVRAKRVYEDRVPQELVGTAQRTVRVESVTELTSYVTHSTGPFVNTGPIPPRTETLTQYTLQFTVDNGSNDVTDASVVAVLPQYVTWLDLVTSDDRVFYNPTTREMTWSIGDIAANAEATMAAQVSIVPSNTQLKTTPTLVERQRFKATDRFTGTDIRSSASALTTVLMNDPGVEPVVSGRVTE